MVTIKNNELAAKGSLIVAGWQEPSEEEHGMMLIDYTKTDQIMSGCIIHRFHNN